jgi:DNA-binding HxlR family transcriptional regulator
MTAPHARYHDFVRPHPQTARCPIQSSMGVFGRKWALLVLRDVGLKVNVRFSDILRSNPGMTPRVLAFRLKELEAEALIHRVIKNDKREVYYELTPAGRDTIPILTALIYFGSKRRAKDVFRDGRPRSMEEMFPRSQRELLQGMAEWAAQVPKRRRPTRANSRG